MIYESEIERFRESNKLPMRDELMHFTPEQAARLVLRFLKSYSRAFISGEIVAHVSNKAYGREVDVERVLMDGRSIP